MFRFAMVVAALAVTLTGAASVWADSAGRPGTTETGRALDPKAAIAYSQAAIGRTLQDFTFLDTTRSPVRLESFQGKPLIVNMVFTACSESCPLVVQSLYEAVDVAQETLGRDAFSVVTIGFDARDDTPERMKSFARGQGVDLPNWHFLSGTQSEIDRLTETLGFISFPSPRGFDHLAQTSIVDAQGTVYRQVYGADFKAPALVDPLLELVYGRPAASGQIETLVNRVRLFCTYFDPATQRYRFDYSIFIAFAVGLGSLVGVGFVVVRALLRARRQDHTGPATLKPEV